MKHLALTLLLPGFLLAPVGIQAAESTHTIGRFGNMLVVTAPAPRSGIPASILRTPMTVDFADTPIEEVAELIARSTGVNVVVDPTLRVAGVSVNFRASNMEVGNILSWINQTAKVHVDWIDGALFFSDQPAKRPQVMKMYDVSDLVMKIPDFPGPEISIPQGRGDVIFTMPEDRPDSAPTHDELIDLLESVIKARQP